MAKKSYKELLKESVLGEFDTSKTVDVQGPMLDAIISYKGDGELHTHQDAASILERYYYGEKEDKGVEIQEAEQNTIDEVPVDNLDKAKGQIEDEVEPTKTDGDSKAVLIKAKAEDIEEDIEIENTVIEKLISELEESETDLDDNGDKEEEEEEDKEEDKKEEVKEQKEEDVPAEDDEEGDKLPEDEKDLDVDKELQEAGGSLPGYRTSTGSRLGTGGDVRVGDELEEAFQIFKEQVEDEDEEDIEDEEEEDEEEEELEEKKNKK